VLFKEKKDLTGGFAQRKETVDPEPEFFRETLLREEGKIGYTETNITIVERMDPP
jgi:hypothetical protein